MMFEALESRRMLNHDLYKWDAFVDAPVAAGESANVRVGVANTGPLHVTSSFFVELKLIHTPTHFGPLNTDFYDPNAVVLNKFQVDANVAPGPGGIELDLQVQFPETLPAGRYSIV